MASEFSRILTLLRKEKNLSQKSAATSLGVSQALLSHYEKGIRECGLDFLVRAADFYDVSVDYMLGRSPDRNGAKLSVDELPEPETAGKENVFRGGSILTTLNKKLIANSLNILYDILSKSGSDSLIGEISNFLMIAVYRAFRIVYSANIKNQSQMFKLPEQLAGSYCNAAMEIHQANASSIAHGKPLHGMEKIENHDNLLLSTELITKNYPLFGTSLLNLINSAENSVGKLHK